MKNLLKIFFSFTILSFLITACKKTEITIPPPQAHFVGDEQQTYSVTTNPVPDYIITVGTTDVSNSDRTVTVNYTSPTGATQGTNYTITGLDSKNAIVIPAGKAVATFKVKADYASYFGTTGRKDTLVFTISEPGVTPAGFLKVVRLAIQYSCQVTLSSLLGAYNNTFETLGTGTPYGPCTTTISSVTSTGANTASVVIQNIWDNGWGPITFTLDNSNPANRTMTVIGQNAIPGSNAGDLNSAYAGQTVAVRPFSGQTGIFRCENGTFTLRMQLGVTNVGWFTALYTVNMAR